MFQNVAKNNDCIQSIRKNIKYFDWNACADRSVNARIYTYERQTTAPKAVVAVVAAKGSIQQVLYHAYGRRLSRHTRSPNYSVRRRWPRQCMHQKNWFFDSHDDDDGDDHDDDEIKYTFSGDFTLHESTDVMRGIIERCLLLA